MRFSLSPTCISQKALLFFMLALSVLLGMMLSATMGFLAIPFTDVFAISMAKLLRLSLDSFDPVTTAVVTDIRLPRITTAVLVGAILGISGTVFQAILLNPLADSYTLGISTGAAFGASMVIVLQIFGIALPTSISIPLFAFLGAVGTLAMVLYLAAHNGRMNSTNLILAGVIVSAILSAAIGFLKFLADEQVGIIIFWLMGSFSGATWQNIALLLPTLALGTMITLYHGRDLNIMATGERTARSLGIHTLRLRTTLLVTCSLMTALAVSVSGIIGFVGLIVPHLLRHIVGPDNRILLPLSLLSGGLLLLIADTLTRAVLPAEVPIGVLTALLGGPFFCIIFKKRQNYGSIGL